MQRFSAATEAPPIKVEGFGGLERLRRAVGSFPTEVGGFKLDFWKMNQMEYDGLIVIVPVLAML
jgi:hypothetical protein